MKPSANRTLTNYHGDLPNRKALGSAAVASWCVVSGFVAANLWNFYSLVTERYDDFMVSRATNCPSGELYFDEYGVYTCRNTEGSAILQWSYHHWYFTLAALLVTMLVARGITGYYNSFYRDVTQGRVVAKDSCGGGQVPLEWMLLVEGYTKANELRQQWRYVSHGTYEQMQIGDFVNLR